VVGWYPDPVDLDTLEMQRRGLGVFVAGAAVQIALHLSCAVIAVRMFEFGEPAARTVRPGAAEKRKKEELAVAG